MTTFCYVSVYSRSLRWVRFILFFQSQSDINWRMCLTDCSDCSNWRQLRVVSVAVLRHVPVVCCAQSPQQQQLHVLWWGPNVGCDDCANIVDNYTTVGLNDHDTRSVHFISELSVRTCLSSDWTRYNVEYYLISRDRCDVNRDVNIHACSKHNKFEVILTEIKWC